MSSWAYKELGDVCAIIGGGTPSKRKSDFYGGIIPWATVRDMKADVVENTEFSITKEAVKSSATKVIPAGNVIIATRVGLGKVSLLHQDTAINQDLRAVIPNSHQQLDKCYLFWWLKSISRKIKQAGVGATVKGVKLPFIRSLRIPIPPLPEQKRIVAILDEAFAAIDKATANGEKNLANARELFEAELRSVFARKSDDWTQKTLEQVSTVLGRGKSKHRPRNAPHLFGGEYPFVQTGDIRNAPHVVTNFSQTYSAAGLAQSRLWPKGTLCITIAANIAETAVLGFEACFPDSVIGVVPDPEEADAGFLEYLFQSWRSRIQSMGKGSAQANINLGTFKNLKFPFPPISEQREIAAELDQLAANAAGLESTYRRKTALLAELKQSLLQKAFAGELTATAVEEEITV